MWRLRTSGDRFLSITGLPATLGSEADNDLRLRHASVLPHHARFSEGPGGRLTVEALGEAVVGVGGRRVGRGTLGAGDELILGGLRFTVERTAGPALRTAGPAPRTAGPAPRTAGPAPHTSGARRSPAVPGSAASPTDELLSVRDKTLRFARQPARRGLLEVDFAQLPAGWKLLILLALLLLGAGLLWGVSLLTGVLG